MLYPIYLGSPQNVFNNLLINRPPISHHLLRTAAMALSHLQVIHDADFYPHSIAITRSEVEQVVYDSLVDKVPESYRTSLLVAISMIFLPKGPE